MGVILVVPPPVPSPATPIAVSVPGHSHEQPCSPPASSPQHALHWQLLPGAGHLEHLEHPGGQSSLGRCGASFHAAEVVYAEMKYEKQTCFVSGQPQQPAIDVLQELSAYQVICYVICIKL